MSEWQPAIIIDVHKEITGNPEWPKLFGKRVRVRESELSLRSVQGSVCPRSERAYEVNMQDAESHGYVSGSDFIAVCEHEILTD